MLCAELHCTSISRVHSDENSTCGVQFDLRPLKQQSVVPRADSSLDGQDLLGHHRQHLQVDTIELIEAGPGTARRQTLEELPQSNVVQTIRTIEHHTLHKIIHTQVLYVYISWSSVADLFGYGFGKILDGLSLACTCWALRSSTQMKMKCSKEGSIAPIHI